MLQKTLNNGVKMPMVGFGTFKMQGEVCEKAVAYALECGCRMIDTAQAYGNEQAVGNAIKNSPIPRDEVFLTSKVNFRSFENARAIVEDSLRYLQTDYLDLVLLHWPFGNYYKAWRDLEKLYEEGYVRGIGISNFAPDRMIDLIGFNQFVPNVNQVETHLFCQRIKEHAWMEKYGVTHQAYSPLGQGRRADMFENPVLLSIAETHGKTPAQVALRFLIQNDICIIPKSTHEERIRENLDICDFELSPDEMARLRTLDTAIPMIGNPELPERTENAMKNWW